ncbi:HepT-like ribonuclease domain-containing protein [Desulfobulbus alkaliphilus]
MVGLRKRIVHDYMNVDMNRIFTLVRQGQYTFLLDFLRAPLNDKTT